VALTCFSAMESSDAIFWLCDFTDYFFWETISPIIDVGYTDYLCFYYAG